MKKLFLLLFLLVPFFAFAASDAQFMAQGKKYYAAKKYPGAVSYFNAAIKANPRNAEAWMYKGYCHLAQKDSAAAIAALEQSIKLKPNPALQKYVEKLKGSAPAGTPSYYTGTYSRSMALSGAALSLRDSSSPFDLYGGAGMSAGLAQRIKKNFTSSDTSYYNTGSISTYEAPFTGNSENSMTGFLIGGDPSRNYDLATYWLDPQDALALKVSYGSLSILLKSSGTFNMEAELPFSIYNVDVVYSRLITPEFSAGACVGYSGFSAEVTEDNWNIAPMGQASRIDWELSALFAPKLSGMELKAALGLGNMYSPAMAGFSNYSSQMVVSAPEDLGMLTHTVDQAILVTMFGRTESTMTRDYSGIKIRVASNLKTGPFDIFAKIGTTLGLGSTESSTTTNTPVIGTATTTTVDPFDAMRNGSRFDAGLKGAYDLDLFSFAAAFDFASLGYDQYGSANDTDPLIYAESMIGLTLGGLIRPGAFTIPLEFYYQSSSTSDKHTANEDITDTTALGFLAGCEFMVTKELALRAGGNFGTKSSKEKSVTSAGTTEGPEPGTEDNPVMQAIGFTGGAGYKFNNMEYNLRIRYTIFSQEPLADGLSEYNSAGMEIGLSVKVEI